MKRLPTLTLAALVNAKCASTQALAWLVPRLPRTRQTVSLQLWAREG